MRRCEGRRIALFGRQHHDLPVAVEVVASPGSKYVACMRVGFPGTREASSFPSQNRSRMTGTGLTQTPRPRVLHLAFDGSKIQVLRWYCQAKATKCGRKDEEESERFIVPQKRGNSSQETPWREGSADLWNRRRER